MTPSTEIDASPRTTLLAGSLLALAALLTFRRYIGINHDAILYLGQALALRWPEIYGQDLFFLHGSQGSYSLFPHLIAFLMERIPPATLFMWGTGLSLVFFTAATWYSLKALLPPVQRYWALLAVLSLPAMYGMLSIFSYNEQFLTARPFAEACCLLSIGLLASRKWIAAGGCLLAGALLHPLPVIAALLVIWPWCVMRDRRWLHLAWFAVPVLLAAWIGVRPFDDLFRTADAEWIDALHNATRQLYVTDWRIIDYKYLAFDTLVLAYASYAIRGQFRAWCAAALTGLAFGLLASLLLVDVLNFVLPAGLQLWRVHWLAHWFAIGAIAAILHRDLHANDIARAMLLALAATLAWGETDWGWAVLSVLYIAWPRLACHLSERIKRLLGWLLALAISLLFMSHAANEWHWFGQAGYRLDLYAIDRRLLAFPPVTLGLLLLCVHAWQRMGSMGRKLSIAVVLVPLVLLGTRMWDARTPAGRIFEQALFRPDIFGPHLPDNAQVFWSGDSSLGPWMILQRANFFSSEQLAGQVFNRQTAVDGYGRLNRMRPLMEEALGCSTLVAPNLRHTCVIRDEAMHQACAMGDGVRPDYLVLPFRQPQPSIGSWSSTDPLTGRRSPPWYLYACDDVMADLRRNLPPVESSSRPRAWCCQIDPAFGAEMPCISLAIVALRR